MKFSRKSVRFQASRIPDVRCDSNAQLTAFSGLVVFQRLFDVLALHRQLRECFAHLPQDSKIYGPGKLFLVLLVHILIGFRRLRSMELYRHDPVVQRTVRLNRLPDVSVLTRNLNQCDQTSVDNVRTLTRRLSLERLTFERFPTLTLDFDGSVLTTKGHVEGTAIGFNKAKKGSRSYYPLFCCVAQTGQFLDMLHRPGNVHDSRDSSQFIADCVGHVRGCYPGDDPARIEARCDSAFFDEQRLRRLADEGVEFTCSVPFERFPELKKIIEDQKLWTTIDKKWSYVHTAWRPKKWEKDSRLLLIIYRQKVPVRQKEPLQLDLFVPKDFNYQYKVVATNKRTGAGHVLHFHNGRGSQEGMLAEAKSHAALDVLPTRRLIPNKLFTFASLLAHNLSRELQMRAIAPERSALRKRPARWEFTQLDTLREKVVCRVGRLIRPQGKLVLIASLNAEGKERLDTLLKGERAAA